jgi:hypothetical protein
MRMNMFAVLNKAKADIRNIRGLNLAVVKLTTVQVTKLPLYHDISKIDIRSKSLWRWYTNTSIMFLDIIHRLDFN